MWQSLIDWMCFGFTGANVGQEDVLDPSLSKPSDEKYVDLNYFEPVTSSGVELVEPPQPRVHVEAPLPHVHMEASQPHIQRVPRPSNNIALAVDDLTIPWSELVLKERIGAGEC